VDPSALLAEGQASLHLGRHHDAEVALQQAVTLFMERGDRQNAARATVSLARERIGSGRFDEAIALLDTASRDLTGGDAARAAAQRALALQRSGRVADAIEAWDVAVGTFIAAGMDLEAAITFQNRGLVETYRGELEAAESDLLAAAEAFERLGENIRQAEVTHDLGFVAARRGDLPKALAFFDQAQRRAAELGALRPEMLVDRVEVCLRAGLVAEGRALAEAAVQTLEQTGFIADVPEACLLAAQACELDDDADGAVRWAGRAAALFRAQGRPRWEALARFAGLRARSAAGPPRPAIARLLLACAAELDECGWGTEARRAKIHAAEVFLRADRREDARQLLGQIIPALRRALPLDRLEARLCQARLQLALGDVPAAERALLAGLDALFAYQSTLGSVELRAAGGGKAHELMSLGVALGQAADDPSRSLWWMEAVRSAREIDHAGLTTSEMDGALASLREVMVLQGREDVSPREATLLRKRQAALEEVVRRCSRHAAAAGVQRLRLPSAGPRARKALAARLQEKALVEYATVEGKLVASWFYNGECGLSELGPMTAVREAVAGLRLALRGAVSWAPGDAATAPARLHEAGKTLQDLVFSPLALPPRGDFIIVADGLIASVPWSLLPSFDQTNVVVAASASSVLFPASPNRSLGARPRTVVIAAPGLNHAEEEAAAVRRIWGGRARGLYGDLATIANAKLALRKADVVHIAAHGNFRADNPLLSTVRLADGPITGDELARETENAVLVVLSCCDIGMADANGVGLSRLLIDAGARAVVASVSPVPDLGTAPLMRHFHEELVQGANPAVALTAARRALGGSVGSLSTAGFVCFGDGFGTVITSRAEGRGAVLGVSA